MVTESLIVVPDIRPVLGPRRCKQIVKGEHAAFIRGEKGQTAGLRGRVVLPRRKCYGVVCFVTVGDVLSQSGKGGEGTGWLCLEAIAAKVLEC